MLRYLCQLCSLFFQYSSIASSLSDFEMTASHLISLEPSAVIQIIPQLMAQLNHENPQVVRIVLQIIEKFAEDHFQALALPLCLLERTNPDSPIRQDLMAKMERKYPDIIADARTFAEAMVHLANTLPEEIMRILEKIENLMLAREPEDLIRPRLLQLRATSKECWESMWAELIGTKPNLVDLLDKVENRPYLYDLQANFVTIRQQIRDNFDRQTVIDIGEPPVTPALSVPGVYTIGRRVVLISDIGRFMKPLPSAKRPRKMRLRGDDGQTYKYLLKGSEDLRLDMRVMQLFSLVNSILHEDQSPSTRHLHIRRVQVVPLAPTAGLIQWAQGGDTLYSIISWYRHVRTMPVDEELVRSRRGSSDEITKTEEDLVRNEVGHKSMTVMLTAIQKFELHEKLCLVTPDEAIHEFIWLKSPSSEVWVTQTSGFARSNALMSVVGYIMGIGDRHPSNILVMKGTYTVVHIDFSDCFEKARRRERAAETVPFRLTRMLVKAFGASGYEGVFMITAQHVMELLRKNRETILAFLDIFTQDPIVSSPSKQNLSEADDASDVLPGQEFEKVIKRIGKKLNGGKLALNAKDQVRTLVETATSPYNLSQMYYGWAPFW
jgi:phosphatidylinositol kinase/protein kinase (PI-3  family)